MRAKSKCEFYQIGAIELSNINGQRYSICKQANQHMATDILRPDFFFLNDENIEFKNNYFFAAYKNIVFTSTKWFLMTKGLETNKRYSNGKFHDFEPPPP